MGDEKEYESQSMYIVQRIHMHNSSVNWIWSHSHSLWSLLIAQLNHVLGDSVVTFTKFKTTTIHLISS